MEGVIHLDEPNLGIYSKKGYHTGRVVAKSLTRRKADLVGIHGRTDVTGYLPR